MNLNGDLENATKNWIDLHNWQRKTQKMNQPEKSPVLHVAKTSLLILALGGIVNCATATTDSVWPPIRSGFWDTEITSPSGKHEKQQLMNCVPEHPHMLFWGYFGEGKLAKGGCKFTSQKTSDAVYLITGVCTTEEGGKTTITHHISLEKSSSFLDKIESRHNNQSPLNYQFSGHWTKDCPP